MADRKKLDWKLILLMVGLMAATLLLWNTPVVYPVKLFVVLLHELSHGLAAVITGGRIVKIEITADQGGLCATAGGWQLLVLAAGYLGSILWGGLILLVASRTKFDKYLSLFIGGAVLVITLLFIRNLFGFVYGVVFGLAMGAIGLFLPLAVNDFILKYIGLTSMLYAIFDIKDDLISRNIAESDASRMGQMLFGNSLFWGVIWIAIAGVAAFFILKSAAKGEELERKW